MPPRAPTLAPMDAKVANGAATAVSQTAPRSLSGYYWYILVKQKAETEEASDIPRLLELEYLLAAELLLDW